MNKTFYSVWLSDTILWNKTFVRAMDCCLRASCHYWTNVDLSLNVAYGIHLKAIFRILPIDLISNLCLYITLLKTLQHPTEAYTLRRFQLIQMFTVRSRKATRIKYQCINARAARDKYFICQLFSSSTCIRRPIWLSIYTHTCVLNLTVYFIAGILQIVMLAVQNGFIIFTFLIIN